MSFNVGGAKESFFDREAVEKAVDKALAKRLSRYGAFVRQRARTSLRYRNATAPAGHPPSAHRTGMKLVKPKRPPRPGTATPSGKRQMTSPLRDFLFFGYDREKQTVIIGPALTNQSSRRKATGGATIPQVLEEGGTVTGDKRTFTVRPHPYMKPAQDAELPKFMDGLKDSLEG